MDGVWLILYLRRGLWGALLSMIIMELRYPDLRLLASASLFCCQVEEIRRKKKIEK
jgi:hypothetical protein